jgi:hypothetical protein
MSAVSGKETETRTRLGYFIFLDKEPTASQVYRNTFPRGKRPRRFPSSSKLADVSPLRGPECRVLIAGVGLLTDVSEPRHIRFPSFAKAWPDAIDATSLEISKGPNRDGP